MVKKNWAWYRATKGPSVFMCPCGRLLDATIQNCIVWRSHVWHAGCAFGHAYRRVRYPLVRALGDGHYEFVRWAIRDRDLGG